MMTSSDTKIYDMEKFNDNVMTIAIVTNTCISNTVKMYRQICHQMRYQIMICKYGISHISTTEYNEGLVWSVFTHITTLVEIYVNTIDHQHNSFTWHVNKMV